MANAKFNNYHFKRARWRLWRQQIQNYLIAAIQNVRILLAHQNPKRSAAAALIAPARSIVNCLGRVHRCVETLGAKLATLLQPPNIAAV